jgi:hypothetical protein
MRVVGAIRPSSRRLDWSRKVSNAVRAQRGQGAGGTRADARFPEAC